MNVVIYGGGISLVLFLKLVKIKKSKWNCVVVTSERLLNTEIQNGKRLVPLGVNHPTKY